MKQPRRHYRLEFISENTQLRLWSIRFTRTRVILACGVTLCAVAALLFVVLRYTPAGKFIPGWLEPDTKARIVNMALKLDSLEEVIRSEQQYASNLLAIMKGEATGIDRANPDTIAPPPALTFTPGEADSLLAPTPREEALRQSLGH